MAAASGGWTSPVVLSAGGQGWESAAAIDRNGNSVAVWDEITSQSQIWSASKLSAGNWGLASQVSPGLQTTSALPAVRISVSGFATAVWSDQNGVWTADRPPASNWESPHLLIPGVSSPIFVMNGLGDAAIAWSVGGPSSSSGSVMVIERQAGGIWSAPRTVASGVHVAIDHAGIAENGTLIVTWETYNAVCKKYGCAVSAFDLHASRQNGGAGAWVDSGSLLGPDGASHNARVSLGSAGQAILVALNNAGVYASATQSNSGGSWSTFKTVAAPQGITIETDLLGDNAGQVTLVYEFIGFSSSQVFAVNGSISNNTWSSPVVLSGNDTSVGQVYFAVAPSGAALVVWLSSSGTPQVHAAARAAGSGTWSGPVAVSGPGSEISPEATAVNSSGEAIVIYSAYNAASVHTEYAVNYQP
jgi:hypothetical protein